MQASIARKRKNGEPQDLSSSPAACILRALSKVLSVERPLSYVKNPRTTVCPSSHPSQSADEKVAQKEGMATSGLKCLPSVVIVNPTSRATSHRTTVQGYVVRFVAARSPGKLKDPARSEPLHQEPARAPSSRTRTKPLTVIPWAI